MLSEMKWLADATYLAVRRKKMSREKTDVLSEYSEGWGKYAAYLEGCETLEDWLKIKGVEDVPRPCNISGKLKFEAFDWGGYNKQQILDTLQREFPGVRSVTEFGCGVGRNLLYLKKHLPDVEFYGYELCKPGVDIARRAAEKFGLDVKYSQLDYVGGAESDYVFPNTDVAFTMYSLEQLPDSNRRAVENILNHTNYGSIHLEPVPENYPYTARGIVGRLDHWKSNYLKGFDKNISSLDLKEVKKMVLGSAHNPLMFPSLYVLKKKI